MPSTNVAAPAPVTNNAPQKTDYGAMAMVTTLFFAWGFLTCLNDIIIPHLKSIFDLNYAEAMLVQFAFFSAYFVFSFPSGKIIDYFGYKKAMVAGLLTMGIGASLFVPAASVPSFPLFLAALITLAAGMTILQTSANPYVAVLGPPQSASFRLNLTQAFNSLGTTVAPTFGSLLILGTVAAPVTVEVLRAMAPAERHAYQIAQASSVKAPYMGLAIALFVLAVIIGLYRLPKIASAEAHGAVHDSVWKYRHLVLGALAIFVYVGGEVSIGSFLINYFNQPFIAGLPLDVAAKFVGFYWGGAMIGRFLGSALLSGIKAVHMAIAFVVSCAVIGLSYLVGGHVAAASGSKLDVVVSNLVETLVNGRPLFIVVGTVLLLLTVIAFMNHGRVAIKTPALLGLCAIVAAILVCTSMLTTGHIAMWTIIFVGLFNSIMFPSIFTLGIAGLGQLTGDGSALLVAAIVGGAIIPELQGLLADRIGIHHAFILPVLCYAYITFYGFVGSKPKQTAVAA